MAYEDFTTFTEFDEGGTVTIDSATKVSWASNQTRAETGYVYKDYGANYFDEDFSHRFEIQFSNMANKGTVAHWGLANTVGDIYDVINAAPKDGNYFWSNDDTENLVLRIFEHGTGLTADKWLAHGPQPSTTYYVTIDRDDDGGANSAGLLTAYIRTGSHTGTLQDTLTQTSSAGEQHDYQYLYATSTYDDGKNTSTCDGYTENLDLQEAAAAGAPTGALYGPLVGPLGGPI